MCAIRRNPGTPVEALEAAEPDPTGAAALASHRRPGVALGAGVVAAGLTAAMLTPSLLPWSLALLWLAVPAWQVALTPVWTAAGAYTYLSPMLFAVRGRDGLELHVGTAYDYLLRLRWADRGGRAHCRIALWTVQGLLRLGDEVRAGRLPAETRVVVTPYFLGERSLGRLGFTSTTAAWPVRLHLVLDLLGIAAMHAFARGRWALPPVWKARTGVATAGHVASQRDRLVRLARRLEPRRHAGLQPPWPPA